MQAPAPRPVPAKDIPSHLRVCCGTMRGNFDVQRALVILDGGREISPTEFERMAGKAASKKWKASVRIDKVSMYKERILHSMSKQDDLPSNVEYYGLRSATTEFERTAGKAAFAFSQRWKVPVHIGKVKARVPLSQLVCEITSIGQGLGTWLASLPTLKATVTICSAPVRKAQDPWP